MFRLILLLALAVLGMAAPPAGAQDPLAQQQEALLSAEERKALQDALVWAGTYEGRIDGAFGPATRRAIGAFQREMGFRDTGYLRQRHVDRLLEERMAQTQRFGWQIRRFPDLGMQMGIPTALFREPEATEIGLRYRSRDGQPRSELLLYSAVPMSDARFAALREDVVDRRTFGRDVYESKGDNWFVFSGRSDEGIVQYTYVVNRNDGVRGFSFRYMQRDAAQLARLNVAMYNSLDTFAADSRRPDPGPATAGDEGLLFTDDELARLSDSGQRQEGRAARRSTGILVSPRGGILTTAGAVQGCERVRVNNRVNAEIRVVDAERDLAILGVNSDGRDFPYLRFRATPLDKGEAVRVLSYTRRGGEPQEQKGEVAALTGADDDFTRFQLSGAELRRGSRGAPVLDQEGRVVGLVHGRPVTRSASAEDDDIALGRGERLATNGLVAQAFLAARDARARPRQQGGATEERAIRRATVMLECIR